MKLLRASLQSRASIHSHIRDLKQHNISATADLFDMAHWIRIVSFLSYNRFPWMNWHGPVITRFDVLFLKQLKRHRVTILTQLGDCLWIFCIEFSMSFLGRFWNKKCLPYRRVFAVVTHLFAYKSRTTGYFTNLIILHEISSQGLSESL